MLYSRSLLIIYFKYFVIIYFKFLQRNALLGLLPIFYIGFFFFFYFELHELFINFGN